MNNATHLKLHVQHLNHETWITGFASRAEAERLMDAIIQHPSVVRMALWFGDGVVSVDERAA